MYILFCTPWTGCAVVPFYYEDVEVVGDATEIDVDESGFWGPPTDSCPECEIAWPQFEPPYPEPADDGGGGSGCGDARDDIIAEYQARMGSGEVGSVFVPTCSDFSSGGSTTYFQWSEVNNGSDHQPFGIVRDVLWSGLENTRAEWVDSFGRGPLKVQSGYRCPVHNQNVNGKPNSRHMYGDAADLTPLAGAPWNADEWEILRQCAHDRSGATYIEDYDLDHSHLHCDWR